MKRITVCTVVVILLFFSGKARAGYEDLGRGVKPITRVWLGGVLKDTSSSANSALSDAQAAANVRVGRAGAYEFHSTDSSPSAGVYLEGAPLPSRYHFELDYYDEDDWYGDLRYSYKDAVRTRVLSRRFYHNLDNLTLFDYGSAAVDSRDAGVDDYGIRVDIDTYSLRFKTPSYPFHFYITGETVSRKGKRQQRFLGGYGYFFPPPGRVRVSESRDVDQKIDDIGFETNAHIGWVEFDLSRHDKKFTSDVAPATYTYATTPAITSVHNVIPEIESSTNTLKVHTTHSGRLFASSTFQQVEKENNYSHAKASRRMGYGEFFWLPRAWLAFNLKYRHQKNTASAPATVVADGLGELTAPAVELGRAYTVDPGVASTTDRASFSMRYSLIPDTSLQLSYAREIKDMEGDSASVWSRPEKTTRDIYELKVTNRSIPQVRTTLRLGHKSAGFEVGSNIINNEPERSDEAKLDLTWSPSPRLSAFASGYVVRDESSEGYISGPSTDPKYARELRQQYVASLVYMLSPRVSLIPSYSFMSMEQKRDLVWIDFNGGSHSPYVDHFYSNKQTAQNFNVEAAMRPIDRLRMAWDLGYTVTKGVYEPSSPIDMTSLTNFNAAEIGELSYKKIKVLSLRLDNDYDLGHGWGLGLDLHYADWKDDSFDNPSDSSYLGALFKVTKKIGTR